MCSSMADGQFMAEAAALQDCDEERSSALRKGQGSKLKKIARKSVTWSSWEYENKTKIQTMRSVQSA